MADDYIAKQVEVAGQILCELIRKDIAPIELREGGMTAVDVAEVYGMIYQGIWRAIATASTTKSSS